MKRGLESMDLIKQWRGYPHIMEKGKQRMKRGTEAIELLQRWRGTSVLQQCLSEKLTAREQEVISLRYGTATVPTFANVAEVLGISDGRCQKIEDTALIKLCHPAIKAYFE